MNRKCNGVFIFFLSLQEKTLTTEKLTKKKKHSRIRLNFNFTVLGRKSFIEVCSEKCQSYFRLQKPNHNLDRKANCLLRAGWKTVVLYPTVVCKAKGVCKICEYLCRCCFYGFVLIIFELHSNAN